MTGRTTFVIAHRLSTVRRADVILVMEEGRIAESGLFEQIGERYGIELQGVPSVGDTLRDVQAGAAVGCEPHLVLTGKGAAFRDRALPEGFPGHTRVHADLAAFAQALLAREAPLAYATPQPA